MYLNFSFLDLKRQSKHSGLRPDTSNLVYVLEQKQIRIRLFQKLEKSVLALQLLGRNLSFCSVFCRKHWIIALGVFLFSLDEFRLFNQRVLTIFFSKIWKASVIWAQKFHKRYHLRTFIVNFCEFQHPYIAARSFLNRSKHAMLRSGRTSRCTIICCLFGMKHKKTHVWRKVTLALFFII